MSLSPSGHPSSLATDGFWFISWLDPFDFLAAGEAAAVLPQLLFHNSHWRASLDRVSLRRVGCRAADYVAQGLRGNSINCPEAPALDEQPRLEGTTWCGGEVKSK
jgi:hypothetical protein